MDDKYLKNSLIFLLLLIFLLTVKYLFVYLSPFIIAAVLASLIDPIVNKIESFIPIHRGFIVLFVLIFMITILITIIVLGISQLYLELNTLLQNFPDYNTFGKQFQWLIQQNNQLKELINNLDISTSIKDILNNQLQLFYDGLKSGLVKLINNLLTIIGKLPMIFTVLFLSFIATFFISRDKEKINQFIVDIFPGKWKYKIIKVRKELINSAIGFIRAELILISITGIITGIGLSILGYHYALLIGITAAVLDLIPIIGPALIFYPWILYNLLTGNISAGLSLLILHTILAAVRSGSEGKIMGNNLGIHPLSTMIALYVGYRTMGTLGFIIGPTVLVIIKALAQAEIIPIYKS